MISSDMLGEYCATTKINIPSSDICKLGGEKGEIRKNGLDVSEVRVANFHVAK